MQGNNNNNNDRTRTKGWSDHAAAPEAKRALKHESTEVAARRVCVCACARVCVKCTNGLRVVLSSFLCFVLFGYVFAFFVSDFLCGEACASASASASVCVCVYGRTGGERGGKEIKRSR